jgi:predicted permease
MNLRDALRALSRAPVFTLATVLVLTLGLGANLLLFNAVQALLWRPLAFPHPDQLMFVRLQGTSRGVVSATSRDCAVIHDHVEEVAEVGMTRVRPTLDLAFGDHTRALEAAEVNSGYIRALALKPLVGSLFGAEEDEGNPSVLSAVLTEAAWRSHFGSDPTVVGRVFQGLTRTTPSNVRILGVIKKGSTLPLVPEAEILIAIPWMNPNVRADGALFYRTLVRLRPGVGGAEASSRIENLFISLGNLGPEFPLDRRYRLVPLRQVLAPAPSSVLFLLYGAAVLLLLLTSANVGSLFLARSLGRLHETAVRHALGARLGHTFLSHFLECLLVCGGGLSLALLLDHLARPLVLHLMPELNQVGPELLRPGWALLGFGTLLCLGVSLVLALLASSQIRETRLREALGEGGHQATRARHPLRAALVSIQVAVILVLLTAGSLVVRSFQKALSLDSGFQAKGAVCFQVDLPCEPGAWTASGFDLASLATALPGTHSAAFSKGDPVGRRNHWFCSVANHPGPLLPEDPNVDFLGIGPTYFETLGARVLAGRTFTEGEVRDDANVVILNASASRLLFPGQDPLGRTLHMGMGDRISRVVGVVQDLRNHALDQPPVPEFFVPYFQKFGSQIVLTVRTDLTPGNFEQAFRARLKAWDSRARMRTLSPVAELAETTLKERFRAGFLVGAIAILGLLIGSAGLYGTLSTQVTQGLRELGMRMALGAQRGEILQLVLCRGARQVALGMGMGLAGSWMAAHFMESKLFGIGALDPISFAFATLVLGLACFIASLIPALRAGALDPAQILRMNQG